LENEQDKHDSKSEKWQESEAAEDSQEKLDALENAYLNLKYLAKIN